MHIATAHGARMVSYLIGRSSFLLGLSSFRYRKIDTEFGTLIEEPEIGAAYPALVLAPSVLFRKNRGERVLAIRLTANQLQNLSNMLLKRVVDFSFTPCLLS